MSGGSWNNTGPSSNTLFISFRKYSRSSSRASLGKQEQEKLRVITPTKISGLSFIYCTLSTLFYRKVRDGRNMSSALTLYDIPYNVNLIFYTSAYKLDAGTRWSLMNRDNSGAPSIHEPPFCISVPT